MTTAAFIHGVGSHAAAFAVLAVQVCVGARLLGWLGMGGLATHERILFGWVAGFSLTTGAWMLLAGTGALGPLAVAAVLVASAAISWPVPVQLAGKIVRVIRTLDWSTQIALALGLVVTALWIWPLFVETLLPNSDWDSALYHLPLAERYATGSLWGRDPYFPAFSFPGAVHLLYAAILAVGLESSITPLNFQITILTLVTTAALARQIGGRGALIWASVAFTTTPILWQLGVDARIDGFLALTLALAIYALVRFVMQGSDVYLKLAALCLGAAIGCKYTALPFVLAVGGVGLGFRLWSQNHARGLGRLLAFAALLVTIPNASWYVANLALHGDPLFPMLRGTYIETPSGERVYLGRSDEEEEAALLEDPALKARLHRFEETPATDRPAHLFDLVDLVRSPERYAVKPNHTIGPLLLLSLGLPFVLPLKRERRRGAILVWAFGWGAYALFGSQTNLLRYALPALPILAATTGVLIVRIPFRAVQIVIGLVAVALFARDYDAESRKLELMQSELALGADPSIFENSSARIEWLEQVGFNFTPPMAYATEQLALLVESGEMSEDCRILMIGEGKGRLLPCDYLPDSSWFAHRFVAELRNAELDYEKLAEQLRTQNITHLLYNRGYYDWVMTDTETARSRLAFALTHVERFLDAYGRPLFSSGGIQLYELRGDEATR